MSELPADKAGILVGDVIVEIAGQKARTPADFAAIVEQLPVGPPHPIRILRAGESLTLDLVLIPRDE